MNIIVTWIQSRALMSKYKTITFFGTYHFSVSEAGSKFPTNKLGQNFLGNIKNFHKDIWKSEYISHTLNWGRNFWGILKNFITMECKSKDKTSTGMTISRLLNLRFFSGCSNLYERTVILRSYNVSHTILRLSFLRGYFQLSSTTDWIYKLSHFIIIRYLGFAASKCDI